MVLRNMRRHVLKNMADVMIGDLVEDLLALAIALDETRPAQQAQMVADEGHGQVEPLGDVAHRDRRRDATQQDFQP